MSSSWGNSRCTRAANGPSPVSPFDFPTPGGDAAEVGSPFRRGRQLAVEGVVPGCLCCSSIARDSGSSGDEGEDDGEVQSSYKGPLDTMDDLREGLIIRQGFSESCIGKSNSSASLDEVSAKDVAKMDAADNRKRKGSLPSPDIFDGNQDHDWGSSSGSTPKKLTNSSRCTSAHVDAVSSSDSNTSGDAKAMSL